MIKTIFLLKKVRGWEGPQDAHKEIIEGIKIYKKDNL
jgi:hypothetical protein